MIYLCISMIYPWFAYFICFSSLFSFIIFVTTWKKWRDLDHFLSLEFVFSFGIYSCWMSSSAHAVVKYFFNNFHNNHILVILAKKPPAPLMSKLATIKGCNGCFAVVPRQSEILTNVCNLMLFWQTLTPAFYHHAIICFTMSKGAASVAKVRSGGGGIGADRCDNDWFYLMGQCLLAVQEKERQRRKTVRAMFLCYQLNCPQALWQDF